ncbi:MAG: hypothetical protein HN919_06255 [Verrucomicrobia bacterium]|jgi:hypothetical protein|nr:hypothetical protein [Verrucomicrobiota bacterium]MBT7065884.1 hypothetical protein [Verrucomicrobiota bacterium]MBT7701118.1 hypothetical protein [Verrucomicrobiota bacterium]
MRRAHHNPVLLAAIMIAGVAGLASAALQQFSFDRYQSILDRQPFGEIKADVAPTPRPGPVLPPFTKDIKMCAILEDDSGIQVGFVNVAIKPPKSYFLYVGGSEDEITLVRADYSREMALLEKGGDEQWISMAGPVDMAATMGDKATVAARAIIGAARVSKPLSASASRAKSRAAKTASYAERLRLRREAMKARAASKPKLDGEELKKHLESYQMDLIRKGMPALPMPLTDEMDAQLVSEGVLPPN